MPAPIYLDHNATTPILPEVMEAMRACWVEPQFNPASQHSFGRHARHTLEEARERIAELVGANLTDRNADRLVFTSGGTESNNLAILGRISSGEHRFSGAGLRNPTSASHLIISTLEHPSITTLADHLAKSGVLIDHLGANNGGTLRTSALPQLLRPSTRLICAMLGQNETGVLQPVAELAAIANTHNIPLHTDAAQVVGKLTVDFRTLGVATMSFAAHKFHGPLGIGALVIRHGDDLAPQLFGGFQQTGLRPGTESVALAVGMRCALELWYAERHARIARLTHMRDNFERTILAGWPTAIVIGATSLRLPHTSNIAFVGLDRQALFLALDQAGVACSTGSACASGSSEPSPALTAMAVPEPVVASALRFSFGATTTPDEVSEAARRILNICNQLRRTKDP